MHIFGLHIRRSTTDDVLRRGDKMTLNMDAVDRYFVNVLSGNVDVTVDHITLHPDGTKEIFLRNAPKPNFP